MTACQVIGFFPELGGVAIFAGLVEGSQIKI